MRLLKLLIINCLFLGTLLCSGTVLFAQSAKDVTSVEDGYLFAYFEGKGHEQEALRFAVSQDAVHWKALNNNKPVIGSDSISLTGGIRDPHILRGEGGKDFYLVATDMNTVKTVGAIIRVSC